jgi:hypothetical protein
MLMRKATIPTAAVAVLAASFTLSSPDSLFAQEAKFSARLQSFNEVPSISSPAGSGSFRATLAEDGLSLEYTLSYTGLTAPVLQAHIHFGQTHTNGAIMVFLCQTGTNPDPTGLAPLCVNDGSVSGTITAANIIQAGGQGIGLGEYAEFLAALQGGSGYANVHTTAFTSGEIRGQVTGN